MKVERPNAQERELDGKLVWGFEGLDGQIRGPYHTHEAVQEAADRACTIFAFALEEGEDFETSAQALLERAS